ncbi:MAG: diguanylate cyclase [Planctomycetota bacterium]|nr:diguanylate cyclase [Planctomycetota bacterium]
MSDPLLSTFSRSGQSLFSVEEVRALMHIEFERSVRYHYPVCCVLIKVDRLSDTATYHGQEIKEEILGSVIELMRKETRAGDILGCLVDDGILALLPHTSPREVGFMLRRLLSGARDLRFHRGGRTQSITLSVGISHNQHPDSRNFETMERVAEEGAAVAEAAGGDRSVETELYALHDKQRIVPEPKAPTAMPVEAGGEDFRDRLDELMAKDGNLEQAASKLAEEILARAMREAQSAEAPKVDGSEDREQGYQREIDNLQRRVAKLTHSLGITEGEIARLQNSPDVEAGVASLYRNVQGLSTQDARAELKKDLMSAIFEANLNMKRKSG